MRIGMRYLFFREQKSSMREVFYNFNICFLMLAFWLHVHPREIKNFFFERPVLSDMVYDGNLFFFRKTQVIFAKCGSDMNNAGSFGKRNKRSGIDFPRVLFSFESRLFVIIKRRFVLFSNKVLPLQLPHD